MKTFRSLISILMIALTILVLTSCKDNENDEKASTLETEEKTMVGDIVIGGKKVCFIGNWGGRGTNKSVLLCLRMYSECCLGCQSQINAAE
jgi:hypothetical protein